jgi:PTH1 family peptidyl-tRNA hydrolase
MNSSGEAVKSVVTKYKLELKDILVICDDVNLPESVLRIRPSGSAGGHKGLRSIIHTLKSEEFPRLRIGVDTKRTKKRDLTSFVLEPINKRSKQTIEKSIDSVVSCCYIWLKEGVIASMNKCNAKDKE